MLGLHVFIPSFVDGSFSSEHIIHWTGGRAKIFQSLLTSIRIEMIYTGHWRLPILFSRSSTLEVRERTTLSLFKMKGSCTQSCLLVICYKPILMKEFILLHIQRRHQGNTFQLLIGNQNLPSRT